MQLRYYVAILRRFWVPILALPLFVGLLSLAIAVRQPEQYGATARLLVTQTPRLQNPASDFPDFNLQYSWSSSEFILDDLPQVIRSATFAGDVSAWAREQGYEIPPAAIQGGLSAETLHRSITLTGVNGNPETASAMVRGAVEVLQAKGLAYWNRATPDGNGLTIALLDLPGTAAPLGSTRQMVLNVALRVLLAFAAAVGLAFLLHYLDDRVRDAQQVEELMDLQVVGVIPRE